jgi:hypothetical protein
VVIGSYCVVGSVAQHSGKTISIRDGNTVLVNWCLII